MRRRPLGRTGLEVSALALGGMGFGPKERWMGGCDEGLARELVARALDAGVDFFDTADAYNIGHSERILAKALGKRRKDVVLATKVFCRMGPGPDDAGLSRAHVLKGCEASLRRLKTDRIDLYQIHEWDGSVPIEETLEALDRLVRDGKVRFIGCSNVRAWQLAKALWASDKKGWARFESVQVCYNLLERGIEDELAPLAADQGLGVLAYSPLAGGWLSGKYLDGGKGRHSSSESSYPYIPRPRGEAVAQVLRKVAGAVERSCAQTALAWALSRPWLTSAIIGASSVQQLEENLSAAALELRPELVSLLDRATGPRS